MEVLCLEVEGERIGQDGVHGATDVAACVGREIGRREQVGLEARLDFSFVFHSVSPSFRRRIRPNAPR